MTDDERRLLVATTNADKIREIRVLLADIPLALVTLDNQQHIPPPHETGRTFADNARQKALYYAARTFELTVAEDSGLEIDALGGEPGVESARYGGTAVPYAQKFASIYQRLREQGSIGSPARFVCALALAEGDGVLFEAQGTVEGRVAPEPKGTGGFGYDPIFFYPPYGLTLGEATAEQKAAVSHRGQAFRALRAFLIGNEPQNGSSPLGDRHRRS